MKVLNVNVLIDPITGGGAAERTVQMSRYLKKVGVQTAILTTDLGVTPERLEILGGIEVIALRCLLKRFFVPAFSLRSLSTLISSVDVVHIMGHWTVLNVLIYLVCRRRRKPYVVCPAGTLPIFGRSKLIKRFYNLLIGRKIIGDASRCIAISVEEIGHFADYGIPHDKVVLIPNGVDLSDFEVPDSDRFRERIGTPSAPIILFVGRLNYIKGPDILLQAFCNIKDQFPNYHLVFAGPDSGMLPRLTEIAAASKVSDRVHFVGYIGGKEKSGAYFAASVLVIPSRQEAMSIVVLEAGSVGTPVLLTDRCGFDDIDRVGGGRVVSATIEGIQHGLIELLSKPSDLKRMGSRLKEFVTTRFTWNSIIQKYMVVYEDVLFRPQS
ncbi:MAG: glycosyltransferase [Planctomycetota bacterium]|jgi:glycosyltransferase involved in cell wall biosynthesis